MGSNETISQNISIAEQEIAETIQNGSKLCRGRAMEILELMRDNQTKVHFPANKNTTPSITKERERITKERKREILEHLETNITDPRKNQQASSGVPCPIACKKNLQLQEYTDHTIKCEKQIEDCKKCGKEYMNNDIHRDQEEHSNVKQIFTCMQCMKAQATKIRIAANHRNICQNSGTKEEIKYQKTPEYTGKEFQDAYNTDKPTKNILKEDFKKRYNKHKDKFKNKTDSTKKILAVLGLITLIYISTFIIMRTARSTTFPYNKNTKNKELTEQTINNKEATKVENKLKIAKDTSPQPIKDKLEKENKPKWQTKKRDRELQDIKDTK